MGTTIIKIEGYIGELNVMGNWLIKCRICGAWSNKIKGNRSYLCPACGSDICS